MIENCLLLSLTDPVKAEHYQDAMMLARERMQQKLNEQTTVYMTKKEEVKSNLCVLFIYLYVFTERS